MRSIGVHELKTRTAQILRRVRDKGEAIQLTYRGKVVAILMPAPADKAAKMKENGSIWAEIDRLAAEIGAHWPAGVSAVEAVREGRREL